VVLIFSNILFFKVADGFTHPDDQKALYDLFNSTNGHEWSEGFRWVRGISQGMDPCDSPEFFKGLTCSGTLLEPNRRATGLLLSYLNLNGTLPASLGLMTEMQEMYMTDNKLEGHLPTSLCNMSQLQTFDAAFNNFTGVLPNCVAALTNLVKLDLRNNHITGSIPPGFGSLLRLQHLFLSDNKLTGTIPGELYNARRLEKLFLSYNQLTGTIPQIWSRFKMKETVAMTGLSWLDVRGNQLTGTYPTIVGDFGAV